MLRELEADVSKRRLNLCMSVKCRNDVCNTLPCSLLGFAMLCLYLLTQNPQDARVVEVREKRGGVRVDAAYYCFVRQAVRCSILVL